VDGLTYSVESDGNMLGRAVISQDSSVFTIRPLSADSGATAGTFTLTFSTTDGDNIATDSADFSLTFVTAVDSSAPTVLLMKASGNSATNAAITYQNSSDVSTGFTEAGDVTASTFSPYRSGGYSLYFDTNGQYLNPKTALDGFTSTSDPFTIEFWIYNTKSWTNSYPTPIGLSRSSDGFNQFLWGNTTANDAIWFNNTTASTAFSSDLQPNEWTHVALVYTGTQVSAYYNGAQVLAPVTIALGTSLSACEFGIGAEFDGANGGSPGNYFRGYMSDIRVSNIARYTSAFTTPTEKLTDDDDTVFLLSNGNPYLADASGGVDLNVSGPPKYSPFGPYDYSAWTADDVGGSVYFDGTGDYITPSAVTAPGTGAVTYEAWVRQENGGSSNHTIFDASTNGFGGGNGITVQISSNSIQWVTSDGITTSASSQFQDGVWHHVAFVRDASNNLQYYVDGVGHLTGATYTGSTSSTSLRIGATNALTPSNLFQGQIANARVTNAEVYTADFTPPTAPLGHITNTELLMNNKSDANVYDGAAGNVLSLIGDVASSTTQRKFTTSSSFLINGDGSRGITVVGNRENVAHLGSADFTIEGWVYFTAFSNPGYVLSNRGSNNGWFIADYSGTLKMYASSDGSSWIVSNKDFGTCTLNTWHHFAAVRDGTNIKLYLDGTLGSTTAVSTDSIYADASDLAVGYYTGYTVYNMTGYLQDVRITKGYARYIANFTPPTEEFEL
jgi:hypothetical protein